MSVEYSGTVTIYGSNTNIDEAAPLKSDVNALTDIVSVSLPFWKCKVKPALQSNEYTDAAGNKAGNTNFNWDIIIEAKDLDYANKEYFPDYHEVVTPLQKKFRWVELSTDYMHQLIDPDLTTPSDRVFAVHLASFDTQDSNSEKYYYDINFQNRYP